MNHEIYQVYNRQNKQFVKMKNGQILECSYFKFEDVPLFGGGPEDGPEARKKAAQDNAEKKGSENENNADFFDGITEHTTEGGQDPGQDPSPGQAGKDEDKGQGQSPGPENIEEDDTGPGFF